MFAAIGEENILPAKENDIGAQMPLLSPETVLVGLVGEGIGLSRTPAMHEVEGAHFGLRYVYRLLDTDCMGTPPPDLAQIIRAAEIAGFAGLNVTYPYKRQAIDLLDNLSDKARRIGAVNTIIFKDGKRYGDNTDCSGFSDCFRLEMSNTPRDNVLLLGAGGAGGAVADAILDNGVKRLCIHDIEPENAAGLVRRLAGQVGDDRVELVKDIRAAVGAANGIINATPVGMAKLPGTPIPVELLRAGHWLIDIIYFPMETEFLGAARKLGCRAMSGSGMAIYQAARAFELFTGFAPDPMRMKASFENLGC
jgi:shikimate dehydrogenase